MQPEYITSDTHFGHANVIRYSNRPFANADEMDEALIHAWNEKVPPNGIVYHIGDVSFHRLPRTLEILRRLNGSIRLIKGNHDRLKGQEIFKRFEWVRDYYEAKAPDGTKVVMCHYPMLTWNKSHHGSWHLHGHSHGSLRVPPPLDQHRRLDVGVDTHPDYAPYSWDEIAAIMAERGAPSVDHHTGR